MGATHEVFNQPLPLADVNLFDTNRPLQDAVRFNARGADLARLKAVGALAGSATMQNEARLANAHLPQLRTHDRYGHRIDEVEFHPGYHALMRGATEAGLHGTPYAAAEQASGHAHVQRVQVHVGIDGDAVDAVVLAGTGDADGDFAAVGDEEFFHGG